VILRDSIEVRAPLATLCAFFEGMSQERYLGWHAGNRRAADARLDNVRFQEGDACDLQGVPDKSFDLTLTVFGAMFAPRPFDVAKEMVRVTRPGGRIVMGNWIPNDPTSFVSQLLKISSAYAPPPPKGFISPMTWGVEANIVERFATAGVAAGRIAMEKDTFLFETSADPEELVDDFRKYYGPTMNAYEAAGKAGKTDELHRQIVALAKSQNRRASGGTSIPATFMRVTVCV